MYKRVRTAPWGWSILICMLLLGGSLSLSRGKRVRRFTALSWPISPAPHKPTTEHKEDSPPLTSEQYMAHTGHHVFILSLLLLRARHISSSHQQLLNHLHPTNWPPLVCCVNVSSPPICRSGCGIMFLQVTSQHGPKRSRYV